MADYKLHQLTIRLDDQTYKALKSIANKRGESMAEVSRRVLAKNLGIEIALGASDTLISTVRKAVATELRKTENRLAAMSYKAGLAAAASEQCALVLIQQQLKFVSSQTSEFQKTARHKGAIFLNQPIDVVKASYEEGEDGIK
ncbi:MAG TPA: hypothetical protein DD811_04090 [Syntrophomonas sp.]|jgi:predicted transcriptional regulator|nr:hypothetical protein [Syntrophomonas sp.]